MKHLKLLTPACGLNRSIFIFFALVLVMLGGLPAQAKAGVWEKQFLHYGVNNTLKCTITPAGINFWGKGIRFAVNYDVKLNPDGGAKLTGRYSYECPSIKYNKYKCTLKNKKIEFKKGEKIDWFDRKNKRQIDDKFIKEYSFSIPSGTSGVQDWICRRLQHLIIIDN
ncbi:MAG: hypothetical protein R6V39_04210 [Desulfovibrionales bacterium]